MTNNNRPMKKIILASAALVALMIVMNVLAVPIMRLFSEMDTQSIKAWVNSLGAAGWLLVLGVQILQIVIALIPGEPVEVLAGALYGGFVGLIVCLIGCVIASSGVFMFSRRFGNPLLSKLFSKTKLDEYDYLKDAKKRDILVFILFLIPGTPKDMLTYVVGTSSMKLRSFLMISTFARIPSVLSSTLIGSTLLQGQSIIAVLIFGMTVVLGVLGIKYRGSMIGYCQTIGRKRKDPVIRQHEAQSQVEVY